MEIYFMGRNFIDLTGQQFGEWTVLEKSNKEVTSKAVYWKCKCSCGNIRDISGTDLRLGRTKKCKQHLISSKKEESFKRQDFNSSFINQTFGHLLILEKDVVKKDGTYIKCKCKCGNIISVRWNNLISGRTKSCGCIKSFGEEKISEILNSNNIIFKREVTFSDLHGENNGLLRFDFGIYFQDKLVKLIEFQGEFHYQNPPSGWTDVRKSDILKKEYCERHQIPLLLIPYWEIDNIDIDTLLAK